MNNRIMDEKSTTNGRTVIGPNTTINGQCESKSDFYLEGEWQGNIKLESLFFVNQTGKFQGEAESNHLIVEGKIDGKLRVKGKVEIRSSAHVVGSVICQQIAIAEGAFFQGSVKMGDGSDVKPHYFAEKRKEVQDGPS